MKKKNNGFSLVELLAVIIVLGIVALIIIPNVISTIQNSKKKAFEDSTIGFIDAARNYMGNNNFEEWESGLTIEEILNGNLFEAKNMDKFTGGKVYNTNGTISVENLTDGEYCANGKKNSLAITDGDCE